MTHINFYTNQSANIPIIPQLLQSSTVSDSRLSLSSSQPLTSLPRLPLSISNRQSTSSSQVSLSSTHSPRQNRLFSKASTFRKSLVESKQNINQSQYFYKVDKQQNRNEAIFLLAQRISKLEQKNESKNQEKQKDEQKKDMKEISNIITKIVSQKFEVLNSKILMSFNEKIELLHEEIGQLKQKLAFPLPTSPQLETLRLCKSMIDDKIIGQKIERIKLIRQQSQRLHDKFNFQNKMWNQKLQNQHKFVQNSLQNLKNSFAEFTKNKVNEIKQEKEDCSQENGEKNINLKDFVKRLELIQEKLIQTLPNAEGENLKTSSISQLIASLHIQMTMKSLSFSSQSSPSLQSQSSPFNSPPTSPNIAQTVYSYMIDKEGCIVDQKGFYLLDLSNKVIKLQKQQIQKLVESGLMQNKKE